MPVVGGKAENICAERVFRILTHLYGPAARCKLNLQNGNGWSCASVSGPCVEQIAPGHHGYPRAFSLILRSALEGQMGHQITNATARPFSILQIQLADLGGYLIQCALGLTEAIPSEPPPSLAPIGERRWWRRVVAVIPLVNQSEFMSLLR